MASRPFFYIDGASQADSAERELIQIDKSGYTVALNRVALDTGSQHAPAAERPALTGLLRRMTRGDLLVVLRVSSLGCGARDVLNTLMHCRDAGLGVHCIEVGRTDLARRPKPQAVGMLRAIVRMESAARSERNKMGLHAAQQNGQRTGRPASLSNSDQERVMHALGNGAR